MPEPARRCPPPTRRRGIALSGAGTSPALGRDGIREDVAARAASARVRDGNAQATAGYPAVAAAAPQGNGPVGGRANMSHFGSAKRAFSANAGQIPKRPRV